MLKIKDSVDLKVLEKYGFYKVNNKKYETILPGSLYQILSIEVDINTKIISVCSCIVYCKKETFYEGELFDKCMLFVNNDLVEKVEDE